MSDAVHEIHMSFRTRLDVFPSSSHSGFSFVRSFVRLFIFCLHSVFSLLENRWTLREGNVQDA